MKIDQYCQRQRCRHVELEQFWQAFASRGFVSDSWAFLLNLPNLLQNTAFPRRFCWLESWTDSFKKYV